MKQAGREAAVAVFTSRERAVVSFLIQIGVGLLLFLALGQAEVNPEVRLASAFAPLLIFPMIFLWKMLAVPATIYAAQRREEEGERKGHIFYLAQLYIKEEKPENSELIYYGFALPPENWMNEKLEEFGFLWRVRVIHGVQYVTEDAG